MRTGEEKKREKTIFTSTTYTKSLVKEVDFIREVVFWRDPFYDPVARRHSKILLSSKRASNPWSVDRLSLARTLSARKGPIIHTSSYKGRKGGPSPPLPGLLCSLDKRLYNRRREDKVLDNKVPGICLNRCECCDLVLSEKNI